MPIKKRTIDRNLTKKGFVRDEKHDHIYYWYINPKNNKRSVIFTKVSHNNEDIDNHLIAQMSKQLRLSKKDFINFVECRIDRSRYNEMMIDIGVIS